MKVIGILLLISLSSLPCAAQSKFMGTGSCSSSNCHGSTSPRAGSDILQNEYVTWAKHDKHSRAWLVLKEPDAERIGKNLGLADPSSAPVCLGCHATTASNELHGPKFTIEDGVSCETCHGASEKWLDHHAQNGAKRADSLSQGLNDIVSPEKRANLCLSCHYGSDTNRVTHRLIGAGHPRLSFELDTFGMLQPRHWQVDQDYITRKGSYEPIRAWLIGQAVLARDTLVALTADEHSRKSIWPELSLFNCYACHHDLTSDQWKVREYNDRPGELRINLSSLLVLQEVFKRISPPIAVKINEQIINLHDAYRQGQAEPILTKLKSVIAQEVIPYANSLKLTESLAIDLVKSLASFGSNYKQFQYEEAEQIAMGISAIVSDYPTLEKRLKPGIDKLYESLQNSETFEADKFSKSAGILVTSTNFR